MHMHKKIAITKVMATGHWPAFLGRKNEKNYFINDADNILFN